MRNVTTTSLTRSHRRITTDSRPFSPRWIEPEAHDTRENALLSAEILRRDGITAAWLVTHAWHMRRSLEAFDRTGLAVVPAPVRIDRVPDGRATDWLPRADHLGDSWFALREWAGRLVRPRDSQALADGIIAELTDQPTPRPTRMAVRQVFDSIHALNDYEALMERLVTRRRSPVAARQQTESARQQARAALHAVGASAPLLASASVAEHTPPAHSHLRDEDRAMLARLLQNEADMAYRRRVPTLMDFLELNDGDTVLDCGCGMGFYLMTMGRLRKLNLVGVDGDVARLDWAEREQVPAQLASVDIHDLPFADNSFDKVLMTEVLEHLADDRGAIREIYRILKPGGILALSVPHANYPFLWDPINKTIEALGLRPIRNAGPITGLWSNHWRLYRPGDLHHVISSSGLQIEALEEQTHYAFPLIHFIVYSIGKPLIEFNLLPQRLRDSADRFRGERNSGSLLNPINLGVRLFKMADARNDHLRGDERTFVSIVVKARKPVR